MAERVTLGMGGGGQQQRTLIELIRSYLSNPELDRLEDGAVLEAGLQPGERLVYTTDSYVVQPLFFPGGDIGSLAVCGTINDLAVMGARPRWLSLGLIIEEGLPIADLKRVMTSIQDRALEAGVQVVTGDTKVVARGQADGLYINSSGIGSLPADRDFGTHRIEPGQALIVSGTLGDHSISVMASREGLEFETAIQSDCAPLAELIESLIAALGPAAVFAMRDLTRGGLAATLNEYAVDCGADMIVNEASLPIQPAVHSASRLLGFEPAVLANEGKLLAVVDADKAEAALQTLQQHKYGHEAALIGNVGDRPVAESGSARRPLVIFNTPVGGQRVVDMPLGELLPRIC